MAWLLFSVSLYDVNPSSLNVTEQILEGGWSEGGNFQRDNSYIQHVYLLFYNVANKTWGDRVIATQYPSHFWLIIFIIFYLGSCCVCFDCKNIFWFHIRPVARHPSNSIPQIQICSSMDCQFSSHVPHMASRSVSYHTKNVRILTFLDM